MSDTATVIQPGNNSSNTKRRIVMGMIIILFLLLGFLFYYYSMLLRPKTSVVKPKFNENYQWIRSIYGISATDRFEKPRAVAIDTNKNIYVADTGNQRIAVFDSNGTFLRVFGEKGDRKLENVQKNSGKILDPTGIAVDENGDVYVADNGRHAILIYNNQGKFIREWLVMSPSTVNIVDDKAYVTTHGPLYIFNKKSTGKFGEVIQKIGKQGRGTMQFYYANGALPSEDGKSIYVADSNNNRIYNLSSGGEIKWVNGKISTKMTDTNVTYQVPLGIALDENGLIYTVELLGRNIAVTSPKGKKLESFGDYGTTDGQLDYPTDIRYQGDRSFVIADRGNDRIQIVKIPITEKIAGAFKQETSKKIEITKDPFFTRLLQRVAEILGL